MLLNIIWKNAKKSDEKKFATQPRVRDVNTTPNINYYGDTHPLHLLNITYPDSHQSGTLLPMILDVHGGGHMYGDITLNRNYCEYLASQNFAVVNIAYRLLPETDLCGMLQDLYQAFFWISQNAESYDLDLEKCFITGDSAGAHLTMLTLCTTANENLRKIYQLPPCPLKFLAAGLSNCVTSLSPYYPFGILEKGIDRDMRKMLLGKAGEQAPWADYMNISEVLSGCELPPVFVIGSENDFLYYHTEKLIQLLSQNQLTFESIIWKKEDGKQLGHVFHVGNWDWEQSKITNNKMLDFFRRYF